MKARPDGHDLAAIAHRCSRLPLALAQTVLQLWQQVRRAGEVGQLPLFRERTQQPLKIALWHLQGRFVDLDW